MTVKICKQCNMEFKSYPSDKQTYCSRLCSTNSRIGKPNYALRGKPSPQIGRHRTIEQRKRLSDAHKGQIPWCKGKHLTDEHKRNISLNNGSRQPQARKGNSEWHKNHKHSEEQKIKMSISMKKAWQDPIKKEKMLRALRNQVNNPRTTGMKQSQETIQKRMNSCKTIFGSEEFKNKIRKARLQQVFPKRNSIPEMIVQSELKSRNIDFHTHYPILGQPDIFIEPNTLLYVDGCFWHSCQKCYPNIEKKYESRKRQINRDIIVTKSNQEKGYKVIRIWEHEIINDIKSVTDRILNELQSHMTVIA